MEQLPTRGCHGVEVIDLDDPEIYQIMEEWIPKNTGLWHEDIGY